MLRRGRMSPDNVHRIARKFSGEFSNDEVFAWLNRAFEDNAALQPLGINVSNNLEQRGIRGEHRGVRIAMDPDLYPDNQVVVIFRAG